MEYRFRNIKVDIEGESHSERMDISMKGFPKDIDIDREKLQLFMDRRHGDGSYLAEVCGTGRREIGRAHV